MSSSLRDFSVRLPRLSALAALGLTGLCALTVAMPALEWRLHRFRHELTPLVSHQKNQGVLLQRESFARGRVLPLYGSSELTLACSQRAAEFFANTPTGFQVCPVGAAGNTCLLMLQKIAALGPQVRGHKVAAILSPSWFQRPEVPADHYAGNFSALQAMRALGNPSLRDEVKRRLAARMLDYPDTLESHPALLMQVRTWCGDVPFAPLVRATLSAINAFDARSLEYEDAIQSALRPPKMKLARPWKERPERIDWKRLLESERPLIPHGTTEYGVHDAGTSPFEIRLREGLAAAERGEWTDFALLLDALRDLGADALIISMPMTGRTMTQLGIPWETRHTLYYSRIESMCRARSIKVKSNEDHDMDPDFLINPTSHPTAVGWLHIDHVLDDFFHNRPLTNNEP